MLKIRCVIVAMALLGAAEVAWGAEKYYRSPVGFPVTLAGNVGEIRAGHFHTGIDVKAVNGVGSPVYAAAQGYVSRVGVSPTGYGNVIYVAHPNGETTVYGHLDSFAPALARWVRGQQYARRSFKVDLYPAKGQFAVQKGERIAALGNSGSSGGPHLHFEVRDAAGRPKNLMAEGLFTVADGVPPVVSRILLYEVDSMLGVPYVYLRRSVAVKTLPDGTAVPEDSVLALDGKGYLAYEVIDFKDGKSNTLGVYRMEQRVDGVANFSFAIDRLDFAKAAFVNTFVEYPENKRARRTSVIRAFISPNNALGFYGTERRVTDGSIVPAEEPKRVEAVFTDDAGNSTVLKFRVERERTLAALRPEPPLGRPVNWAMGTVFDLEGAQVAIPGGALYESRIIGAGWDTVAGRPMLRCGTEDIPLHRAARVAIGVADTVPAELRLKLLMLAIDAQGKRTCVGGKWDGATGMVRAEVKVLGCWELAMDTIAPVIRPAVASGARIVAGKSLRWKVADELSGIASYRLMVDGGWELLEYDPKSETMEFRPTTVAGEAARSRKIVLTVTDAKGNVKSLNTTYIW